MYDKCNKECMTIIALIATTCETLLESLHILSHEMFITNVCVISFSHNLAYPTLCTLYV